MNVDPNKIAHLRKRSSLKQSHLFGEGMTLEDFVKMKERKLQFDSKVEAVTVSESGDNTEVSSLFLHNNSLFKEYQREYPQRGQQNQNLCRK